MKQVPDTFNKIHGQNPGYILGDQLKNFRLIVARPKFMEQILWG